MNIQIFQHEQFGEVRVTRLNGEAMFVANDIAASLGYSNPQKAVREHCKGVNEIDTPTNGGIQRMKYIKQPDVFRLIMRSKLPKAEQYQDWVMEEVLPEIHNTGGFIISTPSDTEADIMAKALLIAQSTIEKNKRKILQLEEENIKQAPKVLFANAVSSSCSSILIGDLAKLIRQNGIETGQRRLFEWMRCNGYLIRQTGESYNMPTQRSMEQGLMEIKETVIAHSDGHTTVSKTVKITGKGQVYFVNKFLKNR